MILLSIVCLLLYVLGAMLAHELCRLHIETEPDGRPSAFRDPAARIVAVLLWPSLAFYLAFSKEADE